MSDDRRSFAEALTRVVHNHGSDHIKPFQADAGAPDPLYARFADSTRTGPTVLQVDGALTAIDFDALGWVA